MSWSSPHLISGAPSVVLTRLERPLDLQPLAQRLQALGDPMLWLDSARQHPVTGRCSILGWDPWLTCAARGERVRLTTSRGTHTSNDHPLSALRRVLARYAAPHRAPLPIGHPGLMGVVGYELNRWIERLPEAQSIEPDVPDLLLFGMGGVITVDHEAGTSCVMSVMDPHAASSRAARRRAESRLEWVREMTDSEAVRLPGARHSLAGADQPARSADSFLGILEPTMSQAAFEAMVRRAQDSIAWGDIFQANLSQRFTAAWTGPPWPLYASLRGINPSPFACLMQSPEGSLVSCSPERLVQVRDGWASARPIAGTRPRGTGPAEDALNILELILSDKERAEHIMLVDLARNDLGRVCEYGSVQVNELMALEEYSHVTHIVSNVIGRMRPDCDAIDVIRAMFPGGTITGCPKVRAMEVIRELEPVGRGWYTGSCGWIGFDGSLDLNILIRTITIAGGRLSFHAGAGIVADSDPTREYYETLDKAAALIEALGSRPAMAHADAGAV